jgi:hypothetical protein
MRAGESRKLRLKSPGLLDGVQFLGLVVFCALLSRPAWLFAANEKIGPSGFGPERLVPPGEELTYEIFFENPPTASAAVERLVIRDRLDPSLDWRTLRIQDVSVGAFNIPLNSLEPPFDAFTALVEGIGAFSVQIVVQVDPGTGEVLWLLQTIDPSTGEPPHDPTAGFLPPNDANHRGEGSVSFAVRPREDLGDGTVLENAATIQFDENPPLYTNLWVNRISFSLPPGAPTHPLPPDRIDLPVRVDTSFCWRDARGALAYSIFLWEEGQPRPESPAAAGLADTCYSPSTPLEPDTVYHWQVVAGNANGQTAGQVWTCKTEPPLPPFRRGDVGTDGQVDISDAILILTYLFLGGRTPPCLKSADANDSGELGLADAVFLLVFLFQGGATIPAPFASCGGDATPDRLSCESYPRCG